MKFEETKYKCDKCQDTGFVLIKVIENDLPYEHVVACDCPLGNDKVYDGRTVSDVRYRTQYRIPRYSELFPE